MRAVVLLFGSMLIAGCGSTVTGFGGSGGSGSTADGSGGGSTTGSGNEGGAETAGGGGAEPTTTTTTNSAGAGGGSTEAPISCGDQSCDANTEQCCVNMQGGSCIPINDNCMGLSLSCSSAATCPGDGVCCTEGSFQNLTTKCMDECPMGRPGPGGGGSFQLCADDEECLNDEPCEDAFGGFKVCGGFGGPGGGGGP